MVRGKGNQQPTAKSEQQRLMWGMNGSKELPQIPSWDPKCGPFLQAVLEVVGSGATLVFRPGSGGRSMGIAIWEGDTRHAPKWVYDAEEIDEWASWVLRTIGADEAAADD